MNSLQLTVKDKTKSKCKRDRGALFQLYGGCVCALGVGWEVRLSS